MLSKLIGILLFSRHKALIDWAWVKEELKKREKIGLSSDGDRTMAISKSLDESLAKARSLTKPVHTHIVKKIISCQEDHIELEGGVRFSSSKIPQYIKGARVMVIFLATIGDKVEAAASELSRGKDALQGYLLDRIGSFAVESLAESLENKFREDYARLRKSVSRRYSPGYCDWPIEEQRTLAKALDFSKIGVSLNESCMMVPKKSISGILAVGDHGVFTEYGSTCELCEKSDCSYRRDD